MSCLDSFNHFETAISYDQEREQIKLIAQQMVAQKNNPFILKKPNQIRNFIRPPSRSPLTKYDLRQKKSPKLPQLTNKDMRQSTKSQIDGHRRIDKVVT